MINVHYSPPEEFVQIAEATPFTREILCPTCGKFLQTKLVEQRPEPQPRRCLVECSTGHRFIAPYD